MTAHRPKLSLEDELQDVELRPPLPPEHCSYDSSTPKQVITVPKALLYRMFVACHVLRVGQETRFTALVLLHRYYHASHGISSPTPKKWIAASCLFLACKTEEEPRRLRDVINVAHMLQFDKEEDKDATLQSLSSQHNKTILTVLEDPPALNDTYWESKEQMVAAEQVVLRMLQFDVLVSHPHRLVCLLSEEISSDPLLVTTSWRRLNDALFSSNTLQQGPLSLACAALCLALEETQQQQSNHDDKDNNSSNEKEDLATKLGLTEHWSQSYRVAEDDLLRAKASLVKATADIS